MDIGVGVHGRIGGTRQSRTVGLNMVGFNRVFSFFWDLSQL